MAASLAGLALTTLTACGEPAGREQPASSQRAPIAGGMVDLEHTSVFAQFAHMGANSGGLCTGTLIAPNLILTARHCVTTHDDSAVICGQAPLTDVIPASDIIVTNQPDITTATLWFTGRAIEVPPEGDDTCGFDVALLILAGNVPDTVAVPYVPRIDRIVDVGEVYTAVGYGLTSTNASGERQQRSGLSVQCAPGTCGAGVRSREFVGETGICEGDSGGPALDATGKVVGVVSRGTDGCESPVYTAVSQWRDWLLEIAAQAAIDGGYAPPFWVTTGRSDPPTTGSGGASSGGAPSVGGAPSSGGSPPSSGGGGNVSGGAGSPAGRPCDATATCPDGYACYYDSKPADAVCTPRCETGCGEGLSCNARLGVCTAPSSDDDGCSVAAPGAGRPARGTAAFLAASLLMIVGLGRRRRP